MSKKLILFLMLAIFGSASLLKAESSTVMTMGDRLAQPVLVAPENQAMEVAIPVTLTWETLPAGTVEYRLLLNSVYALPESTSVIVDWTTDLVTSYEVEDLYSGTQYFWRVDVRDAQGDEYQSAKWGFTTAIKTPKSLEVTDATVFENEDVELKWKSGEGAAFVGEMTVCDGTTTSGYVPLYGLYADAYLKCNMVYPAEMLEDMEGGEITSLKYYISQSAYSEWTGAEFQVYMMEVPGTTVSDFTDPSVATTVYTGSLSGTGTEMVVTLDTPFTYNGGNLLIGFNNNETGSYSSCYFYGVEATGACVQGYSYSSLASITPTQRNFLPKVTFVCGGKNRTLQGYNVYANDVKMNDEIITDRKYTIQGLTYNMEGYNIAVTAVHSEGESGYSNIVPVYVSGNGAIAGHVYDLDGTTGLAGATVTLNGEDEFGDEQTFTATTGNGGIYFAVVKAGTYDVTASLDGFSPLTEKDVVVTYQSTTVQDFIIHESYNPVNAVLAEELDETMAKVSWSFGNMPGPGGAGDEFMFDFEDATMQGWTNIDADGDGYTWMNSNDKLGTGYGYNSDYCVLSQSYDNGYGVLYPDNYMVSPQKYNVGGSSVFSMWACGQDASYSAEHFGIAVAEVDNPTAADFTIVSEWTIGGKSAGSFKNAKRETVRGTRGQSTWIEYTCDLSAYAGKQVWIAVRHFNCSDMFYIDADDFSMYNAAKGDDRSLQYYTVYRQQTLNVNGPVEEPVAEVLNPTCLDTAFVDFNWGNMETGVYQYGVQVTYAGNHNPTRAADELTVCDGTETSSYVPVYGLYADSYLKCQMIYPEDMLADMVNGEISSLTFYTNQAAAAEWTSTGFQVYMTEYPSTTISSYIDAATATTVYTGKLDATGSTMTVTFDTPYTYEGGNLLIGINNNVKGNYKSAYFYGIYSNGSSVQGYSGTSLAGVTCNQRNFLPKTTFTYEAGSDSPVTEIVWSNYLPKNMMGSLNLSVITNSNDDVRGAVVTMENISEPYLELVYEAEMDSTGLYAFDEFRLGRYAVEAELAGFESFIDTVEIWEAADYQIVFTELFPMVEGLAVSSTGYAHWSAPARSLENYFVKVNGVAFGQTDKNYMILDADFEDGETYTVSVAAAYTTGLSGWATANFTYSSCENYPSNIEEMGVAVNCMDVAVAWSTGAPVPPTPGEGDEFTEGWDNGLNGWTNIDADGDGHVWYHSNDAGNHSVLAPTSHGGSGHLMGESYCNGGGALTPNDFIVTPQKYSIADGSTFSFYACASDEDYASEHFGVAISTDGNTSASDFTTVAEWTLTAKEGAKGPRAIDGTRQGSWYNYSADLSSYAGQEVWIAIRHFNCTDQFIINIDDAELAINGKGGRDGNWYGYDNNLANEDAIGTGGGNFWWGIMLPAGSFEGTTLSKTAAYDYMAMSGTVSIYQGGASAPSGSALATANVTMTGSSQYLETVFDTPVTIDPAQNVWVVYYNGSAATYPAAVCANTGDANGRWVSLDGSSWADLASYGLSNTFMVRAYIEAGSGPTPGPGSSVITPNSWAIFLDGEFVESVSLETNLYMMTMDDAEEHEVMVVKVDADYNMSCGDAVTFVAGTIEAPEDLTVTETEAGISLTWGGVDGTFKVYRGATVYTLEEIGETEEPMFLDPEFPGSCYYGVRSVGECGMSDMTVVEYVSSNVNELNAETRIYPNPTMDNIRIEALGMRQVTIVNALGQTVYSQNVNANEMTVNMSQFGAGMYIVNIITENGTSTQRVNVVK